ncbi:hypothetical protein [Burkholderia phage FLC9]|nr:hypothetical protein [Burkholderia phage FLC9]
MTKLISYEELRQQLMADQESDYAKFIEKVAQHHPVIKSEGARIEVQIPMVMYLFKTTNRKGEAAVAGVPACVTKWHDAGIVDLACQSGCDDIFFTMEKAEVTVNHNLAVEFPTIQYVVIENSNAQWILDEVAKFDEPQAPKKAALSLVVDNVNQVETLRAKPELRTVETKPDSEMDAKDILDILRTSIGRRFMPTSLLDTYGTQKSPTYLKTADDGDLARQLLSMDKSGLFMRDALRSKEVFAVLNMDSYNIIVSLIAEQVFMGAKGGVRMHEWVPRSGVDVARLMLAVTDL